MSTYDLLVVLPPMPPEQYRQAVHAALAPYHSELEVPPYREYEPVDPDSADWVRANKESGRLPDRADLGWAEIAELMNAGWEDPSDDVLLHVDEAGHGYFLSTRNPRGEWDGLRQRLGGPRLLHRPDAAGDPRLHRYEYADLPPEYDLLGDLPDRCDGGPRGLLDFEALRAAHERLAAKWHAAGGTEGPRGREWSFRFTADLDETVALARAHAVPGYGLLRLDGSWSDVHDDPDYLRNANAYLDALDPEAVVLDVCCHG